MTIDRSIKDLSSTTNAIWRCSTSPSTASFGAAISWVDRLGRNYADVTEVIRQLMGKGVVVKTVINGLVFDGATKDSMQKAVRDALIAFMAATAEARRQKRQGRLSGPVLPMQGPWIRKAIAGGSRASTANSLTPSATCSLKTSALARSRK